MANTNTQEKKLADLSNDIDNRAYLLNYFQENYNYPKEITTGNNQGTTGDNTQHIDGFKARAFNATAWNQAYKLEKIAWASYEIAEKFELFKPKSVFDKFYGKRTADRLRKDIIHSHFLTEVISSSGKKIVQGIKDDVAGDAEIAETVLDVLRVAPRLVTATINNKAEKLVKEIRKFHGISGRDGLTYKNGDLEVIRQQSDVDKILKKHNDILKNNKLDKENQLQNLKDGHTKEIKIIDKQLENRNLEISVKSELIATLDPQGSNADSNFKLKHEKILSRLKTNRLSINDSINNVESSISGIKSKYSTTQNIGDISDSDLVTLQEKEATLASLKEQKSDLDFKINVHQTALDQYQNILSRSSQNSPASGTLLFQVVETDLDKLKTQNNTIAAKRQQIITGHNTEIQPLEASISDLKNNLADFQKKNIDPNYKAFGKRVDVGYSALGFGKATASLVGLVQKEDKSLSAKLGIASNSLDILQTTLDGTGAVFEGVNSTKYKTGFEKSSKALVGVGTIAGVGSSALSFASIAKQLNNPKLKASDRKYLEAEVGLQGAVTGLATLEGALSVAQSAVSVGSKAANVLGKAIPVIGALGSIAGAINPIKWSEFNQKQNRIDNLNKSTDYSAGILSDLLQDTLNAEKGFYAATTAIDGVTGVVSAGLAASGVGAGIGVAVGLIGGAISGIVQAFEQVAINDIAKEYADKLRTDKNGNKRSIEDFFKGSFEQQQKKTRTAYEEFFESLVSEKGGFDNVISLGSQTLTGTDISLAALTGTGGELGKTATHYFQQYKSGGNWDESVIRLSVEKGKDRIILPQSQKENSYVTFTSPLLGSGVENLAKTNPAKYEYVTKLTINDLAGWTIEDRGNRNTTFDLSKLVTSAQSVAGKNVDLDSAVRAGGGDDTIFVYDSAVDIDGGSGKDSVSYSQIDPSHLDTLFGGGVYAKFSNDKLDVYKQLSTKSKQYKEKIASKTETRGKETEKIDYRTVTLENRNRATQLQDKLTGIEVFHGSQSNDGIDLSEDKTGQIKEVWGGDGNDTFFIGLNAQVVISGGNGNDTISIAFPNELGNYLQGKKASNKIPIIDGGDGYDTIKLHPVEFDALKDIYEEKLLSDSVADFAGKSLGTTREDIEATAKGLTTILSNASGVKKLPLHNIEAVEFTLKETGRLEIEKINNNLPPGKVGVFKTPALNRFIGSRNNSLNRTYFLQEYSDIINNSLGDGNLGLKVSGGSLGSINIVGSDKDDHITAGNYDDLLFGGEGNDTLVGMDGNDVLVGGSAADTYVFKGNKFGHDAIIAFDNSDGVGDKIVIEGIAPGTKFEDNNVFGGNADLIIKISRDASITLKGYYHRLGKAADKIQINYTDGTTRTLSNLGQFDNLWKSKTLDRDFYTHLRGITNNSPTLSSVENAAYLGLDGQFLSTELNQLNQFLGEKINDPAFQV